MPYTVAHVSADPEIRLRSRLGGLFTSSLSLTENIEAMLRATSQMMQFDAATVFLLNEGSRELTACATYPHQDMVPHIAWLVMTFRMATSSSVKGSTRWREIVIAPTTRCGVASG